MNARYFPQRQIIINCYIVLVLILLIGKLGNSKLSISTKLQKFESSNAIAINADEY